MKKKLLAFFIIGCTMMELVGCRASELEERCFPLAAMVGYKEGNITYCLGFPRVGTSGEKEPQMNEINVPLVENRTFEAGKTEYEEHLNKTADYNHLKVLVFEGDLLANQEAYYDVLEYLAETEEFPRNTYVCVVDDIAVLSEMEENLPQDIGSYLEEYLTNHEEKKDRLLTLGDLIDEKENQQMILYMPYLRMEENYVEWKGYMNNQGQSWQES